MNIYILKLSSARFDDFVDPHASCVWYLRVILGPRVLRVAVMVLLILISTLRYAYAQRWLTSRATYDMLGVDFTVSLGRRCQLQYAYSQRWHHDTPMLKVVTTLGGYNLLSCIVYMYHVPWSRQRTVWSFVGNELTWDRSTPFFSHLLAQIRAHRLSISMIQIFLSRFISDLRDLHVNIALCCRLGAL